MKLRLEDGTTIEAPDAGTIEEELHGLKNEFAILEVSDDTFMQTTGGAGDGFVLEYQDGSSESHYQAEGPISIDNVVAAFQAYATGSDSWKAMFTWTRIEIAERKGCLASVALVAVFVVLVLLSLTS